MPATPMCPRCGYDLSGLVASWKNACPLSATCAECGLEFSCANTLSERLLGPGWSYEHALRARVDRFWGTTGFALRPWCLCILLSVDHRVNAKRAVRFALWWLAALHAILVVAILLAWLSQAVAQSRPPTFAAGCTLFFRAFAEDPVSFGWLVLFPYVPVDPPHALYRSVESPLGVLGAIASIPTLLMPAWMVILGDTFAAASVRRVHLLRGLAYSLPGAAAFLALWMAWAFVLFRVANVGRMMAGATLGLLAGFLVYHAVWWFLFIRRYLRLPHAVAVVGLMELMSGLVLVIWVLLLHNRGYLR